MPNNDRLNSEIMLLHRTICPALSDPTRIRILYLLNTGESKVNALTDTLALPQATVSRHLRVLRECRLVKTRREGNHIIYSLADRSIIAALNAMRRVLRRQLAEGRELADSILTQNQNQTKALEEE